MARGMKGVLSVLSGQGVTASIVKIVKLLIDAENLTPAGRVNLLMSALLGVVLVALCVPASIGLIIAAFVGAVPRFMASAETIMKWVVIYFAVCLALVVPAQVIADLRR